MSSSPTWFHQAPALHWCTALQWLELQLLPHSKTVAWIHQVTSSAITTGEVSSLDHEVLDHTVELAALEAKSFLGVWRENTE